jgi:hypothetical protein
MKLGIMQPYFLPYIGYWQLMNAVDKYIIYDEIEYSKKGWINRNRLLMNNTEFLFSIPLKKDSDYKFISQREISNDFNRNKLINQIKSSYFKSPYFDVVIDLLNDIIYFDDKNLFNFILNSINKINVYLGLNPNIVISSTTDFDNTLKGENKVLSICKKMNASVYYNAIGGKELYSKERFLEEGIELKFIKSNQIVYPQYNNMFVPWLSIVDVMMFNSVEEINVMLDNYELV